MKKRTNMGTAAYPNFGWRVVDNHTGATRGTYKTRRAARLAKERFDLEYGGYRYGIIEQGETPDQDRGAI